MIGRVKNLCPNLQGIGGRECEPVNIVWNDLSAATERRLEWTKREGSLRHIDTKKLREILLSVGVRSERGKPIGKWGLLSQAGGIGCAYKGGFVGKVFYFTRYFSRPLRHSFTRNKLTQRKATKEKINPFPRIETIVKYGLGRQVH